jgi:hypothetical protein
METTIKPALTIADRIEAYDRLITVKEIAKLLNEQPSAVYARASHGTQPCVRIGARVRFDPDLTAPWLREQSA